MEKTVAQLTVNELREIVSEAFDKALAKYSDADTVLRLRSDSAKKPAQETNKKTTKKNVLPK